MKIVQIRKTSVHILNTNEDIWNVLGEHTFNGGTEISLKILNYKKLCRTNPTMCFSIHYMMYIII